MDKVRFLEVEGSGITQTHAIIDHGNGEFTSMPKAVYDAQVEHLTDKVTDAN